MPSYRFGDIVVLDYPFTDASGSKRRPGLVLLPEDDGDILFARITSQEREGRWEVAIQDWSQAGLLYPSVVRLSKLVSLESSIVWKNLGRMSERDQVAISLRLEDLIKSFHPVN